MDAGGWSTVVDTEMAFLAISNKKESTYVMLMTS